MSATLALLKKNGIVLAYFYHFSATPGERFAAMRPNKLKPCAKESHKFSFVHRRTNANRRNRFKRY
jgi:hypothetical protein